MSLELDPAQLKWAMDTGRMTRGQVEHELTRYVVWRRKHRFRADWTEAWTLWVELIGIDRAARRPAVPEWQAESNAPTRAEVEAGKRGVDAARDALSRAAPTEPTESEVF